HTLPTQIHILSLHDALPILLHLMYFADEIRNFGDIDKGAAMIKESELGLATRLIDELSVEEFHPDQYQDEYRQRVLEVVNQKAADRKSTRLNSITSLSRMPS